jgi:hypothetical protein
MTAIAFCAADSHLPRDLPPGRAVHLMDFTFLARRGGSRQREISISTSLLACERKRLAAPVCGNRVNKSKP